MRRLICRLRGHRWQDIRVIKSIDFKGTDQHGNLGYVVQDAEWTTRCARCGQAEDLSPRARGDLPAASFGFKS
jgi:hypothetical protein